MGKNYTLEVLFEILEDIDFLKLNEIKLKYHKDRVDKIVVKYIEKVSNAECEKHFNVLEEE